MAEETIDASHTDAEAAKSWHHVSLRRVAGRLDVGVVAIARRFRDRDAIADAWLLRARHPALAADADAALGASGLA